MAAQFYKINYKSDFVLTINSDAGWAVPFCIKFWTGMPSHGYFAGFDGENYVNCRVGETPTQLLVMFDDHHMPIGPLRMQIAYHTTIEEFPDRKFDEVTNPTNVTVDIDGTEYQVMLDFTGETGAEIDFSMPSSGVMSVNGKIGYVTLNAEDVGAQSTIEDLATIRSGAAAGATAVQPAEMTAALATKQDAIPDLANIRSGAAAGATAVQPATLQEGLATKQNVISDLATIRSGAAAGATAVQPAAMNTALAAKQDTLTFDNAPTANSNNPVKSSGIKTALDAKQSTISTVNVTVDNNTGTPSGSASVSGSTLSLSFQNLKGATGATGATGPQGPQGERGLPGESGVTGDVSGFTVIQTIDPSATYGATDIAGAAALQAANAELTELAGKLGFAAEVRFVEGTAYINTSGAVESSTTSHYSYPFLLQKGQTITVITGGSSAAHISSTTDPTGNTQPYTPLVTSNSSGEYSYTATEDIYIVICLRVSGGTYSITPDGLLIAQVAKNTSEVSQLGGNYSQKIGSALTHSEIFSASAAKTYFSGLNIPAGSTIKVKLESNDAVWTSAAIFGNTTWTDREWYKDNMVNGTEYEITANVAITSISVFLITASTYGTLKLTVILDGELSERIVTLENNVVVKDGIGQVKPKNIEGVDYYAGNLFDTCELFGETGYAAISSGRLYWVTNTSSYSKFDGYLLPVEKNTDYTFHAVRFYCLVDSDGITALNNAVQGNPNGGQITINSANASYIYFSWNNETYPKSNYVVVQGTDITQSEERVILPGWLDPHVGEISQLQQDVVEISREVDGGFYY